MASARICALGAQRSRRRLLWLSAVLWCRPQGALRRRPNAHLSAVALTQAQLLAVAEEASIERGRGCHVA